MNTNRKIILMTLAAVAIIAAIIYAARTTSEPEVGINDGSTIATTTDETATIACTMDAKMCPDGSYVGRTGPKCQFVCPTSPTEPGTQYPADTFK
jgi:hypothetical protein